MATMLRFRYVPSRRKIVIGFAVSGFVIAEALFAYTFYLAAYNRIGNSTLFLVLCPPSIGALGLEGSGVWRGAIGWLFISVVNAGIYGVLGFVIGRTVKTSK